MPRHNMDAYQTAKEDIKRAADIAELIGQYVQLKKAGQNLLGLCPFHSEKTPSFTVSPSKQMFHCFGCKVGGDIFRFWMEYHKVSFPQAMRDLADKYQITLPERKFSQSLSTPISTLSNIFIICFSNPPKVGPGVNTWIVGLFHRLKSRRFKLVMHPVNGMG